MGTDRLTVRDHGKTTLTAAIATVLSAKFGGEAKKYDEIDAAPEEKGTRHHHQHRPRRIRNGQPPLRPRGLPRPRRLRRQEHDHRCRPDGRRHPGVSAVDGPMPQTREYILLARQVGVPYIIVFPEQGDMVDDAELPELVETSARTAPPSTTSPGDDTPSSAPGQARPEGDIGRPGRTGHHAPGRRPWTPTSHARARSGRRLLMPGRRVLHLRPRHRRLGPRRARYFTVGEEIGIVGIRDTQPTPTGVKRSGKSRIKARLATTSVSCCAAPSAKTSSAASVCKPGSIKFPHPFHG